MAKKSSTASKATSLFDIRLKNLDHDVLVLKGSLQDAASVLLMGKIVLSLNEPITIKKISLRLYCTMNLEYELARPGTLILKPMKLTKKVYEHTWDPNELKQKVLPGISNTSPALSRNASTTSLKNFGSSFMRSKSSSHLSSLSSTNLADQFHLSSASGTSTPTTGNSGMLMVGNHEIPFSAILPGSMPESVEGLPGGSVVYRLEAIIERGKFHSPLITKKHLRVIRTLTTDAIELSETVAVDNTWPNKIEYSLNVPSKAIAIGSQAPISFMMVPLLKGLRLGDIKIIFIEYYSYMGYYPPPFNGERIINEKFIQRPDEDDPNFQMDRWEVDTYLTVPDTLAKVTQDCDVLDHLRVRHKLKFVIGLINPDGHVSELRASLPIQLFISPFIAIRARQEGGVESETSSISEQNDGSDDMEEELLFPAERSSSHASLSNLNDTAHHSDGVQAAAAIAAAPGGTVVNGGFMAPPVYENHVYDRLWSDISPLESPAGSGPGTPHSNSSFHNLASISGGSSSANIHSNISQQFSMSPLDSQQLNENLRQLSLQRQLQDGGRRTATFNLDDEGTNTPQEPDYFNIRPHGNTGLDTPGGVLSPPDHLSRAGSETNVTFKPENMVKVPSYTQAMRSDFEEEALSPVYQPPLPGSNINLDELEKKFEEMNQSPTHLHFGHSRSKLLLSRGSSSINITSLRSSPSSSRNVSYSNLSSSPSIPVPAAKKFIHTISGGIPINNHKVQDVPPELLSAAQLSTSATDRSANLKRNTSLSALSLSSSNLQFLNRKSKQ